MKKDVIVILLDATHLAKQKAQADDEYYSEMKHIEANSKKLTPEYLEFMKIQAIGQNHKIYYGNSIPNIFLDNDLTKKPKKNVA